MAEFRTAIGCPVWRPNGGGDGDGAIQTLEVECPEDSGPGDELMVETGLPMGDIKVTVPDDVMPGDTFQVSLDPDQREKVDSKETLPDWIFPWPEDTVKEEWPNAALLIIDYQNYIGNPDVGIIKTIREKNPEYELYYVPRVLKTVANTKKLLHAFRMMGKEVVYTRHGPLLPDGRDMVARRQKRDGYDEDWVETDGNHHLKDGHIFPPGTFEHDILDELAPREDELILNKNSSSVFK